MPNSYGPDPALSAFYREERRRERAANRLESLHWLIKSAALYALLYAVLEITNW